MSKFIPAGTLQAFEDDDDQNEIELYDSSQERRLYDNFADLYAIIMTTESLEKGYANDAITRDEVCPFSLDVCLRMMPWIIIITLLHCTKNTS